MASSKKIIISNWKMAPSSLAEVKEILEATSDLLSSTGELQNASLIFCPPFVFIEEVSGFLKMSALGNIGFLGAQDIFWEDSGSDTGEISGPMLDKLGVSYVIAGHSERRWKLGESNDIVNKKITAILRNGMIPVVCIGEKTRDDNFKDFLRTQIDATFSGLSADDVKRCLIAYEPVWAISSNPGARPDTPESAAESIKIIKDVIAGNWNLEISDMPRMLYGGSVNSTNIIDFLAGDEISGVLVGSASVNKAEFLKILTLIKAKL